MAWSEVVTKIANPASGRRRSKKKNMAKPRRKMTAKQIRHFGTKRQKAALKAKRRNPTKKRHHAIKRHRPRTKKRATPVRHRPRSKKRINPVEATWHGFTKSFNTLAQARQWQGRLNRLYQVDPDAAERAAYAGKIPRPRKKKKNPSSRRKSRKNPELVSFLLGNPARKRSKKGMARHYKRRSKKSAASRSNAGRRRTKKAMRHHHRRRNPSGMGAIGNPKTWLYSGAGALAGFVGSAAIPQMLMPSNNTGMTGYAMSLAASVGLGFLAHMVFKSQPIVTVSVIAGGIANLLRRVITDQTPYGSYLNGSTASGGIGMGDYMVANWGPPRMSDGLHSAMAEAAGTPWSGGGGMVTASSGVSTQDMVDMRSSRPC